MVTLAVVFQSAPVLLPVAGLAISPLATLPIALAAIQSKPYGVVSWLAAAFILFIIFPQESAIFACSTGLLGLFLGMRYSKKIYISVIPASFALFVGILALVYVFQINLFGDLTPQSLSLATALAFLAFSMLYACICAWALRLAVAFLIKIKVLKPNRRAG